MFKQALLSKKNSSNAWTARDKDANKQSKVKNSDLAGAILFYRFFTEDPAQTASLLKRQEQSSPVRDMVISLHRHFGNQTVQSLLNPKVNSYPRVKRACSCGGACAKCSNEKQHVNINRDMPQQLQRVLQRPAQNQDFVWTTTALSPRRKALDVEVEDDEFAIKRSSVDSAFFPSRNFQKLMEPYRCEDFDEEPRNDSATIVCDGSGGYRVDLGSWAGYPCGIPDCITRHEESHIADWQKKFPEGCKDKPDGAQVPTGGPGYNEFLKKSECKAYNVEISCEEELLSNASKECKPTVQSVLDDSKRQKKRYCGC